MAQGDLSTIREQNLSSLVDLIGLPPSEISTVWRSDWTLWLPVAADGRIPRTPIFVDYAIAHPQLHEVDPRVTRPSASVPYTTDWNQRCGLLINRLKDRRDA